MGTTPPPFESKDLTVITYRRRTFECYPVLAQELQTLVSGYTSVYLALFGTAFGAFSTLLITVLTVPLEESIHRFFKDATFIAAGFTVLLGVMAGRDWWKSVGEMKKLKKETTEVEVRAVESHQA
jgi:hypothetical protein